MGQYSIVLRATHSKMKFVASLLVILLAVKLDAHPVAHPQLVNPAFGNFGFPGFGSGNTAGFGNGAAGPGGAKATGVATSAAQNGGTSTGTGSGAASGDQFGNFQAGGKGNGVVNGGLGGIAEVAYLSVESAHPAVLADLVDLADLADLADLVDLVDSVSPTWVAATEQVSELDPLDLVAFQPPESELHPHRMEDRPLQPELVSHHQLEA